MDTFLLALVGAALGVSVVLALLRGGSIRPRAGDDLSAGLASLTQELKHLAQRVDADTRLVSQRLEGIDSRMTDSHVANQGLARDIFGQLGDVQRATSAMAEQARQFTSLQDLLKAPKARGGLGEAMLEELLRQVLPPQAYGCQERFSTGVIADAVVKVGGRKVCIDSKFPLSNYQAMCAAGNETERLASERAFAADVDKHINDISARYIVPDEGTLDFAVMYVPAEGLYGEVLRLSHRKRPLFEAAIESRVVPMSPLTMYGYLQTILFGLRCLRIEENAERILDHCGRLQLDMERFAGDYDTLGKHLTNAYTRYGDATRRLDRFRTNLDRVVDFAEDDPAKRPSKEGPPSRPSLEVIAGE